MDEEFFDLPPEHEAGVYANAFSIWHTMSDFTLDFAATQSRQDAEQPALIVARVRIPTTRAFALIRTINLGMANYEQEWGEIVIPSQRIEE